MTPLVAAVVLLWIVTVTILFALVGLQQNLRRLEQRLERSSTRSGHWDDATVLKPSAPGSFTCALMISDHCPICASVLPTFIELSDQSEQLDLVVLSRAPVTSHPVNGLRTIVDPSLYERLDPGWQPAIVIVDGNAEVVAIQPAGSDDAVRSVLGSAASRARQVQGRQ